MVSKQSRISCTKCRSKRHEHKRNLIRRAQNKPAVCAVCSITYTPLKQITNTCSIRCLKKHERATSGTHRKRARHYGVEYMPVNKINIFKRDGWMCQACGCNTPLSLVGTLDDNAPELDHVVPISKGGPHTPNNLQCLCRICNCMKGSMDNNTYINSIRGAGA